MRAGGVEGKWGDGDDGDVGGSHHLRRWGGILLEGLEETGIIWGLCPYADVQCLTERYLLYLGSTAIKQENDNTSFRNASTMTPKS